MIEVKHTLVLNPQPRTIKIVFSKNKGLTLQSWNRCMSSARRNYSSVQVLRRAQSLSVQVPTWAQSLKCASPPLSAITWCARPQTGAITCRKKIFIQFCFRKFSQNIAPKREQVLRFKTCFAFSNPPISTSMAKHKHRYKLLS